MLAFLARGNKRSCAALLAPGNTGARLHVKGGHGLIFSDPMRTGENPPFSVSILMGQAHVNADRINHAGAGADRGDGQLPVPDQKKAAASRLWPAFLVRSRVGFILLYWKIFINRRG